MRKGRGNERKEVGRQEDEKGEREKGKERNRPTDKNKDTWIERDNPN